MRSITVLCALLLAGCASASAQPEQQACANVAEPWRASRVASSARDAEEAAKVRFSVGEAVRLSLHPDGEVAYVTLPQGEGEPESFGGLASFTIEQAGIYSVGLSQPIWVDVARNGKPAEAIRFGPGPACSGIRKAVAFELRPGPHILELSGSTEREVGILVARER